MVWKTADRTVVGQVGIGRPPATPPFTPPVTPPITPPVTPAIPTTFYEDHVKIKKAIDKKGKSGYCITPAEIAADTSLPLGTVNEHLRIFELDEAATTVQKGVDNPAICSTDALDALIKKLRKLRV